MNDLQTTHDELIALLETVSPEAVSELARRLAAGEVDGFKYGLLERKCGCPYGTLAIVEGIGTVDNPGIGYEWIDDLRNKWPKNEKGHTPLESLVRDTIIPGEVSAESRQLLAWIASYQASKGAG